ncbi:hypothetical protein [Parahaliea mediterranea]|uniref:Uncharacterized protein n=1 Tax=Parahaliea mediterranea TaxID=651086 RepID=A0A939IMQ6_9GAMM|nr:hypothetical protein [Parahaliea mediterranea]MBN7797775.1 hypothetical protein [Parahaliea mediterranea]
MTEDFSAIGLTVAILLPWLTGTLLARLALWGECPLTLKLAHGYLLGNFATIVLIRICDALGWQFSFWGICASLGILSIIALLSTSILRSRPSFNSTQILKPEPVRLLAWHWFVLTILLGLTLIQVFAIAQEIILRPTFPWDAWRGWEPKTIQYFTSQSLYAEMFTIGNYGEISPQIHLWAMLGANSSTSPSTHLPWLFAFLAIGLAIYGQCRINCSFIASAIAGAAVMSLPYLSIHAALAGYADIWLALAFTLGIITVINLSQAKSFRLIILTLIYAYICLQSKRAGFGMSLIILLCLFVSTCNNKKWLAVSSSAITIGLLFLWGLVFVGKTEITLPLPEGNSVSLTPDQLKIPGIANFSFNEISAITPLYEALFKFGSWHLTIVLLLLSVGYAITHRTLDNISKISLAAIASGFIYVGIYFSVISPMAAENHTGLSRSLLYMMPLCIYLSIYLYHRAILEARDKQTCPSGAP